MSDFFKKIQALGLNLSDIQQQAIVQTEGPLLLLACPGSGKTTTLIVRIAYLIKQKQIAPQRIKMITFSRAAVHDLKNRMNQLFPSYPKVDISTIHRLAFEVTRTYLQNKGISYHIIEGSGRQQKNLSKTILLKQIYEHVLKQSCPEEDLRTLSTFISNMKNRMIPLSQWTAMEEPFYHAGRIAVEYERMKQEQPNNRLLDFDDMLTIAVEALDNEPALRANYSSRFDYVLTDESQDTSLVQHRMIEYLVATHQNLCVVADDDQSIYTWRGADPTYLLQFRSVYPHAVILRMEQNYRSSKDIVHIANQFIQRNKYRYPKQMFTENTSKMPVLCKRFEDRKQQLEYVTYELLHEQNLGNTAILYRNNASSTLYVHELHRRGIPFYMKDGDDLFFSHWIVKDILNFMRLSYNIERKDIFSKIALKMNLFLTSKNLKKFMDKRTTGSVFQALALQPDLQKWQREKLMIYDEIYASFQQLRPAQVIRMIRYELDYEEVLKSRAKKFGYRWDHLVTILDTLEGIAEPLRTMVDFAMRLKELEQAVQRAKSVPNDQAVTLSTIHSAKGLEFQRVFMIDLVKGVMPLKEEEADPELLEESRRLFYVGMTRAKERLELISYEMADGKPKEASLFFTEVQQLLTRLATPSSLQEEDNWSANTVTQYQQLTPGMEIVHRVFGAGTIEEVNQEEIRIRFAQQTKRLSSHYVLKNQLLEVSPS